MSAVSPFFRGAAALLIRGTVDSNAIDEQAFNDWWTNEHLPERLGIPGFLRARRYFAPGERSVNQYLVCYETQSLDILSSKAYLAALDDPTPKTRKFMPLLSGWNRSGCSLLFSTARKGFERIIGGGVGGSAVLFTFECPAEQAKQTGLQQWISESLWPSLSDHSTPLALHLFEHDDKATGAGITTKCYDGTKVSNSFVSVANESIKLLLLIELSQPMGAPFGDSNELTKLLKKGLKENGVDEVEATVYGLITVLTP